MKKLLIIMFTLITAIMMSSCDDYRSDLREKISSVEPEVDYSFISINERSFMNGRVCYEYEKMAYEIIKKKCDLYIYKQKLVGDNMYFYYQYNSYFKLKKLDGKICKYETFDVALFKVNITNANCQLIYDFKDLYPEKVETGVNPEFSFVVDDDRAVALYNGYIQVLDIKNKEIVDSIYFYDKENISHQPLYDFCFNEYGDFYIKNTNSFLYYKLDGYKYELHEFEMNSETRYISRIDNFVYTSCSSNEILNCYDLTTNEPYDVEQLKILIDRNKVSNDNDEDFIEVNNEKYCITQSSEGVVISDSKNEIVRTINEEYMIKNSEKFNELYSMWDSIHRGYHASYYITDNKLFVGFFAHYNWANTTPLYVYEHDILSGTTKYVGFIDDVSFGVFYIT